MGRKIDKFNLTTHAGERFYSRGVSSDDAKNVVIYARQSQFQRMGAHGGQICRFWQRNGDLTLSVVAEIKGSECWILTAWTIEE